MGKKFDRDRIFVKPVQCPVWSNRAKLNSLLHIGILSLNFEHEIVRLGYTCVLLSLAELGIQDLRYCRAVPQS